MPPIKKRSIQDILKTPENKKGSLRRILEGTDGGSPAIKRDGTFRAAGGRGGGGGAVWRRYSCHHPRRENPRGSRRSVVPLGDFFWTSSLSLHGTTKRGSY